MNNYFLSALISYFLGNFSTSYIIGKTMAKIDIRDHGSGNAGTTNVLRTLGKKAALWTFLGDGLKGAVAVFVGLKLGGKNAALISALFVVLGHDWPVLLKFRGGKGVATTLGSMLAIYPLQAIFCMLIGIITIYKSRYVSLGSILGICAFPFFMFFKGKNEFILSLALMFLILFTHRTNIKRLINKKERKIGQKVEIR
ncbi:glycerol-3-phosphate 1-O-acyltransferase PlsY [Tepidibacter formicigenes]|jgi:glycerol-3-phosphate acyltransferase PlsY|uniref:Glycerol-3-phosphate acyltransferase n=1 Tax=Tepidibacter formicigenes DSM 15518 TaxID=1123349 RepID=A0A1M6KDU7_9FIRM|nr:glycerol-3-phosphate 1-O-acyltransferase PlsY [Tepidibacter formicigenes]SHJ57120.1 acyl-phosphate glycerol-3-phosphate acyltransferase [Tepidibacter formicigenes DSM 15518]